MESDNPNREVLTRSVVAAAERGDRLAFTVAAQRLGSLEDAHEIVRNSGILRMVDRVATPLPSLDLEDDEARSTDGTPDGGDPTMFGHFAVFNEWTEINSIFEGRFMEQIAPRAFRKTIRENRSEIKPLFQHGMDPTVGDKPLGAVDQLREDNVGAYYEVSLLDAPYVRSDILPGLKAGLYGASFRFQVMREEFAEDTVPSDHNPHGLPERTVKELRLYEFGPVTFPAYQSATAGVRSANGDGATDVPDAPNVADAADERHLATARSRPNGTSVTERRVTRDYLNTNEEVPQWRL